MRATTAAHRVVRTTHHTRITGNPDDWETMFALNVHAPMRLTRRFAPVMQQRGVGTIVNIGSIAAVEPMTASCAYAATKYALRGWSLSCYQVWCCAWCSKCWLAVLAVLKVSGVLLLLAVLVLVVTENETHKRTPSRPGPAAPQHQGHAHQSCLCQHAHGGGVRGGVVFLWVEVEAWCHIEPMPVMLHSHSLHFHWLHTFHWLHPIHHNPINCTHC